MKCKIELQNQSDFKKRVVETSGLIILDNNVVLDKNGKIVSNIQASELLEDSQAGKNKKLLPEINDRLDFR